MSEGYPQLDAESTVLIPEFRFLLSCLALMPRIELFSVSFRPKNTACHDHGRILAESEQTQQPQRLALRNLLGCSRNNKGT